MIAPIRNGFAKVKCLGCGRKVDKLGVRRPAQVVPVDNSWTIEDFGDLFCWKALESASPWKGLKWTKD